MKIRPKWVLKSVNNKFSLIENDELLTNQGKLLYLTDLSKRCQEFIALPKQLDKLYCFLPSLTRKAIFTAQWINGGLEINQYSLKGDRKCLRISESTSLFSGNKIDQLSLINDQFDSSIVYGLAKYKTDACLFAVDMHRVKIIASGYLSAGFQEIKASSKQTKKVTVCGKNYIKIYKCEEAGWEFDDSITKRLPTGELFILHEHLYNGDILIYSDKGLYILNQAQLKAISQIKLEVLKIISIQKGFILLHRNNDISYFIDEGIDKDSTRYQIKAVVKANFTQQISDWDINPSQNSVYLRTCNNYLYRWEIQEARDQKMQLIQSWPDQSEIGTISMASQKRFALLVSNQIVSLVDLHKNTLIISKNYSSKSEPKMILAGAINPDGNSFILAFEDKLKIQQILLTNFKSLSQFPLKRCRQIVFSHGGQFVACAFGKGQNSSVMVINTLRMVEVTTCKAFGDINYILWNELDQQLTIGTQSGLLTLYKLSDLLRPPTQIQINQPINLVRYDYSTRRLIISCDTALYLVDNSNNANSNNNGNPQIIKNSVPSCISNFHSIFPLHKNYFVVDKLGNLYWSGSLDSQIWNGLSIFNQGPMQLIYRNGLMLCINDFRNVVVLQFHHYKQNKDTAINDEIVFVQRQQITKMMTQVNILQNDFESLQVTTTATLQNQKIKHKNDLNQVIQKFSKQMAFLNTKYRQAQQLRQNQQRQGERFFEKIENGQSKNVSQLQKMYDRKLALQKQKYMQLEQESLEQKMKYQSIIADLQGKHHAAIQEIRRYYSQNMKVQFDRANRIKSEQRAQTEKLQLRVLGLQEENELVITELQLNKDGQIKNLIGKIVEMENKYDKSQLDHQQLKDKYQYKKTLLKQKTDQISILDRKLSEANNQIKVLQNQINRKNNLLDYKQQTLEQSVQHITQLQRAKFVLSFRTSEIRKQIEPKDQLVQKLKEELFKLDGQLKNAFKRKQQLQNQIQKQHKLLDDFKKENSSIKNTLKQKCKSHSDLLHEIYRTVNDLDAKQWNNALVKIYQGYVKGQIAQSKQNVKAQKTAQQLNKHLWQVQQTLVQYTSGNQRLLKAKQKQVIRKMKQNAELVHDLNLMRKNENQLRNTIKIKQNQISNLKRQLEDSHRHSTRAHTAKTGGGFTRRAPRSREKQPFSDLALMERPKQDQFDIPQRLHQSRNRSFSANKTMILRDDRKDRSRFFQLAKQLQLAKATIFRQDKMIQELNQHLLKAL